MATAGGQSSAASCVATGGLGAVKAPCRQAIAVGIAGAASINAAAGLASTLDAGTVVSGWVAAPTRGRQASRTGTGQLQSVRAGRCAAAKTPGQHRGEKNYEYHSKSELLLEVNKDVNVSWLKGRIIGSAGVNVRRIREETGVHVLVDARAEHSDAKQRLMAQMTCIVPGASLDRAGNILKELAAIAMEEEKSFQEKRVQHRRSLRRKHAPDTVHFVEAGDVAELSWFKGRLIGRQGIHLQSIAAETGVKFDLVESCNAAGTRRGLEARVKSRQDGRATSIELTTAIAMLEKLASDARHEEAAWRSQTASNGERIDSAGTTSLMGNLCVQDTSSLLSLAASEARASPSSWKDTKLPEAVETISYDAHCCDITRPTDAGCKMWLHLDRAVPNQLQFLIETRSQVDLHCLAKHVVGKGRSNMQHISDQTGVHVIMRVRPPTAVATLHWKDGNANTNEAIDMLQDLISKAWHQLVPEAPGLRRPVTAAENNLQRLLFQIERHRRSMESASRCRRDVDGMLDPYDLSMVFGCDDEVPACSLDSSSFSSIGKESEYENSSSPTTGIDRQDCIAPGKASTTCGVVSSVPATEVVQHNRSSTSTVDEGTKVIIRKCITRSVPGAPVLPPWLGFRTANRPRKNSQVLGCKGGVLPQRNVEGAATVASPVRRPALARVSVHDLDEIGFDCALDRHAGAHPGVDCGFAGQFWRSRHDKPHVFHGEQHGRIPNELGEVQRAFHTPALLGQNPSGAEHRNVDADKIGRPFLNASEEIKSRCQLAATWEELGGCCDKVDADASDGEDMGTTDASDGEDSEGFSRCGAFDFDHSGPLTRIGANTDYDDGLEENLKLLQGEFAIEPSLQANWQKSTYSDVDHRCMASHHKMSCAGENHAGPGQECADTGTTDFDQSGPLTRIGANTDDDGGSEEHLKLLRGEFACESYLQTNAYTGHWQESTYPDVDHACMASHHTMSCAGESHAGSRQEFADTGTLDFDQSGPLTRIGANADYDCGLEAHLKLLQGELADDSSLQANGSTGQWQESTYREVDHGRMATHHKKSCAGDGHAGSWQGFADTGKQYYSMGSRASEGWMGTPVAWHVVPVIPVFYLVGSVPGPARSDILGFHDVPTVASTLSPLEQDVCHKCGTVCTKWRVNWRDLHGKNNRVLSPRFDISFGTPLLKVPFKMTLLPKGAPSFQRARDRATVHLKCEGDQAQLPAHAAYTAVCFRIGAQASRGPFEHDFTRHAVYSLPKGQEAWDLRAEPSSFAVRLDILPRSSLRSDASTLVGADACLGCAAANTHQA